MSKLSLALSYQPCQKSTRGDTCSGSCCIKSSGPNTNLLSCVPSSRCKTTQIISTINYYTCEKDDDGNICFNKCCGRYTNPDLNSCEIAAMCQGIYIPELMARASATVVSGLKQQTSDKLSTPTIITISIISAIGGLLLILMALMIWKLFSMKKELKKLKNEMYYKDKNRTETKDITSNQTFQTIPKVDSPKRRRRENTNANTAGSQVSAGSRRMRPVDVRFQTNAGSRAAAGAM